MGAEQSLPDAGRDLAAAARRRDCALVARLAAQGASLEYRDAKFRTPLLEACAHGHYAVAAEVRPHVL